MAKTDEEKAADTAAAEQAKADKAAADAKAKAEKEAADAAAKVKKVRVILEKGTLGTKLLVKGDETSDAEYVSLLGTKRGKSLVEAVK